MEPHSEWRLFSIWSEKPSWNISKAENTVTDLNPGIAGGENDRIFLSNGAILGEGYRPAAFWGFKSDGIFNDAAELAAATTVVLASGTGLPISTTHTLVGAVLGVGLARGLSAVDFSVVGRIIVSWVVTLPVGAGLSILFFSTLKGIFL